MRKQLLAARRRLASIAGGLGRSARKLVLLMAVLLALGLVVAGVALIYAPAGLVVAGILLMAVVTFDPGSARRITWPR
jgi:hypothetical protein